jgi:sulfite reductase (NADPH) flavoprotein alpha-component
MMTRSFAALQAFIDSDFGAFLALCGATAAFLAFIIIGGVIMVAMIGDARLAARRKCRPAKLFPTAGPRPVATIVKRVASTRRAPLTILFATETGNAEAVAGAAGQAAARIGLVSHVVDMADTTPSEIAKTENLLVVASTWGDGEPPQRAADFCDALMTVDAPRFDGVRFAVLALGDRAYARASHFCETGRDLDARLAQLGGTRMAEISECDADYEAQAAAWIGATLTKLAPRAVAATGGLAPAIQVGVTPLPGSSGVLSRGQPFEVEIKEKTNLNRAGSGTRTFHIELALRDSGILHEPGDSVGFLPQNDPAMVEEVLNAAGLGQDDALRKPLRIRYDITTLTLPQVVSYARLSGDRALAADEARIAGFVGEGRQLIDLLTAAPRTLTAEQLTGLLRLLTPRLYSIANSRKATPNQVDLLVAAVEYEAHGRTRKGVASIDVAERRQIGDRMQVYLKPNPHFRLPADPARPIIMVGPGTGVAPFRAFMQERAATGATGRNWLFFGNRHRTDDFLYQAEWQDFQKRGVLSRLDVAFSRDQPEKIYVQDHMWDARHDLYTWIQGGAALYICGDASAMARDVNAMLLRIASDQGGLDAQSAQAWLDRLRRDGRYLRDVY